MTAVAAAYNRDHGQALGGDPPKSLNSEPAVQYYEAGLRKRSFIDIGKSFALSSFRVPFFDLQA